MSQTTAFHRSWILRADALGELNHPTSLIDRRKDPCLASRCAVARRAAIVGRRFRIIRVLREGSQTVHTLAWLLVGWRLEFNVELAGHGGGHRGAAGRRHLVR